MALVRKKSSARLLSTSVSESNNHQTQTYTDYNLNIDKSLLKKLKAAKRVQHLTYTLTAGGMVAIADAATYELLKSAMVNFYNSYNPEHGSTSTTEILDSTGKNTVQITVRVNNTDGESYTVNMYNTTSKLLINGKNIDQFLNVDIKVIHDRLSSTLTSEHTLKSLNELLKSQLINLIEDRNQTHNKREKPVEETESPPRSPVDILCAKCKKACRTKATLCTHGNHWVHYNCEKLTNDEINIIENSKSITYKCKLCESVGGSLILKRVGVKKSTSMAQEILDEETTFKKEASYTPEDSISNSTSKLTQVSQNENVESENNALACTTCGLNLIESDEVSCETCQQLFHKHCINTNDLVSKCYNCIGIQSQNHTIEDLATRINESTNTIKLSELRDKEIKLRKWEEELVMKEKILAENKKEITKLNTHIRKLENEKIELENTIRTLNQRIKQIDPKEGNFNYGRQPSEYIDNSSSNEKILQRVHEKVTNFILKQLEVQIDKLDKTLFAGTDDNIWSPKQKPVSNSSSEIHTSAMADPEVLDRGSLDKLDIPKDSENVILVKPQDLTEVLTGQPLQYIPVPMKKHTNIVKNPLSNTSTNYDLGQPKKGKNQNITQQPNISRVPDNLTSNTKEYLLPSPQNFQPEYHPTFTSVARNSQKQDNSTSKTQEHLLPSPQNFQTEYHPTLTSAAGNSQRHFLSKSRNHIMNQ